uniref:Uncharacterized protein n=1 Tax=Picea glauca TaxID=3330 RepID=A0A117NJ09_PICGL|nr:hypothetical protein ABT39_MTgene688 [Picea glauca]
MDGSYTTRATTAVVSGAAGETVALTRSSAYPMDMELGKGTGSSTGTTTTGSAAGSGAQTASYAVPHATSTSDAEPP